MIRLLADTKNMTKGTPHGFGIDEDTALVITHGDTNHMNARVRWCSELSLFNLEIFVNIRMHYYKCNLCNYFWSFTVHEGR